jgi:hypothetical protein
VKTYERAKMLSGESLKTGVMCPDCGDLRSGIVFYVREQRGMSDLRDANDVAECICGAVWSRTDTEEGIF